MTAFPVIDIRLQAVARFLQGAEDSDLLDAFGLIAECPCWHCEGIKRLPLPQAIWLHSMYVIMYPPAVSTVTVFENVFLIYNRNSFPGLN